MSSLSARFFAFQSSGKRDYQEDDYGLLDARESGNENTEHTVIVVADGMGGHVSGDKASGLVTEHFIEAYQGAVGTIPQRLELALQAANGALATAIIDNAELEGMGSTLVAAVISENKLYWVSVGDSPLWLFRNKVLQRLNADHSMTSVLQQMVADGRISQEQADADPDRHSLLSVLMGDAIELIDLRAEALPLADGDLVLLASDGLLTLNAEQISAVLAASVDQSLANIVASLHQAIEDVAYPNQDNITITLYRAASQTQLQPELVTPDPKSAPIAASARDSSVPNSRSRLLFPIGMVVLILAAYLFSTLGADDQAEQVPLIGSPIETTTEDAPPLGSVPTARPELPASNPGQDRQELPVSEKRPAGIAAPASE